MQDNFLFAVKSLFFCYEHWLFIIFPFCRWFQACSCISNVATPKERAFFFNGNRILLE